MNRIEMAFLMDPLERIDIHKDTTYTIMKEAARRGHNVYHLLPRDLYINRGMVMGRVFKVRFESGEKWYCLSGPEEADLRGMDVIFMREDPPFDMDYLYSTYLLGLIEKDVFVVNSPRGVREANEKLYALNFPDIIPEYAVTSDIRRLKEFLISVGGKMVVKPLNSCGGSGVFVVFEDDMNMNATLETVTSHGTRHILAQRYIPEIREGDKRLIILNGEPIGAVNRVPGPDEHRANIHVGASCVKAQVTDRDRHIAGVVSERFARDGIYLAGLDVIGGLVTEINVTSPTGFQEINRLDKVRLEEQVVSFVEERVVQYFSLR